MKHLIKIIKSKLNKKKKFSLFFFFKLILRKLSLEIVFNEFGKRFNFHFYGEQETNRDSAPEWFFTQIIEWIDKNQLYFEVYLQKYFDDVIDTK